MDAGDLEVRIAVEAWKAIPKDGRETAIKRMEWACAPIGSVREDHEVACKIGAIILRMLGES